MFEFISAHAQLVIVGRRGEEVWPDRVSFLFKDVRMMHLKTSFNCVRAVGDFGEDATRIKAFQFFDADGSIGTVISGWGFYERDQRRDDEPFAIRFR